MVHDCIIVGVFGVSIGPSNILIGLTSFSYNVFVVSTNQQKKVIQIHNEFYIYSFRKRH
jgi:hypothetical protein